MSSLFGNNIVMLDSVDSTNDYAMGLIKTKKIKEGVVVVSNYQEKGKGQRGRTWESECNKNILVSCVIEPKISIDNQFCINIFTSLAVYDFLSKVLSSSVKIKWPNDIMVNAKKIAGIRIQNKISNGLIKYSIIGIGININQRVFKSYTPEATSLIIETNKIFDLNMLINDLLECINIRYLEFVNQKILKQRKNYLELLYLNKRSSLFYIAGEKVNASIHGLSDQGKIILLLNDNSIKEFDAGELKLVC